MSLTAVFLMVGLLGAVIKKLVSLETETVMYYVKVFRVPPLTSSQRFSYIFKKWKVCHFFLINSTALKKFQVRLFHLSTPQAIYYFYCYLKHSLLHINTFSNYIKDVLAHVQGARFLNFQ